MKLTAEEIADFTGGKVQGDGRTEITGFAKIEEAREGDLSFIANNKYAHFAQSTKASAILVSEDFHLPSGNDNTVFIKVKDPYASLAVLMGRLATIEHKTGIEQPCHIDESAKIGIGVYIGAFAYVGKNTEIGENVKIYPHAFIGEDVTIGDNTIVYPHSTIYRGCKIGSNCILHAGCVVGADGFGFAPTADHYEKIPQIGIVKIEDNVEIGANTTIDRATMGCTVIGNGTKLDNLIQVAHNVKIGENNVFAAQTGVAGSTEIGNWNRIGGQSGFAGHIKFGNNCEVGAQTGINKGCGDNARIIGYPAVNASVFARLQVYLKRLPRLFEEIEELKKRK